MLMPKGSARRAGHDVDGRDKQVVLASPCRLLSDRIKTESSVRGQKDVFKGRILKILRAQIRNSKGFTFEASPVGLDTLNHLINDLVARVPLEYGTSDQGVVGCCDNVFGIQNTLGLLHPRIQAVE